MIKFSIVIPVYNVEKYIKRCLESVKQQSYQDYEVIIVNDGTKDNSQNIIDEFLEENNTEKFKSYLKENGGLSDARNYGVKLTTGDYIIFIDSDDYIDRDLLQTLNEAIEKNNYPEVISYNFVSVQENGEIIKEMVKPSFQVTEGEKALKSFIIGKQYFEPAWGFAYKKEFYDKNSFEYPKGKYHEDLALTPKILLKAKSVLSIDYIGYYYVQSANSIIRNSTEEKEYKKAMDFLEHFDNLLLASSEIKEENTKILFYSYIANSAICRVKSLKGKYKKEYQKEIKKRNVVDMLLQDSFSRKIKAILLKIKY